MIVSGCTGSFVAPGSSEPEVHLEFGGNSVVVPLVFECFWCFVGVNFGAHHTNLPLYFCKWDNLVPICIVVPLVVVLHWGWLFLCLGLNLYGWFRNGRSNSIVRRGIGQSFLNSKRFPEIFLPWAMGC